MCVSCSKKRKSGNTQGYSVFYPLVKPILTNLNKSDIDVNAIDNHWDTQEVHFFCSLLHLKTEIIRDLRQCSDCIVTVTYI